MMNYFEDMTYVGELENPDRESRVGSVETGVVIQLHLKLKDDVIGDVRYRVYGNSYAIAAMAYVAHWLIGKNMTDLAALDHQTIVDALEIPEIYRYCAVMIVEGVRPRGLTPTVF